MAGLGRGWLPAGMMLGLWMGAVCAGAQSDANPPAAPVPANQAPGQDQWKQKPEGRAASAPTDMNCSGSITSGDGKVEKITTCPPPTTQPHPGNAAQQFPFPGESTPEPAKPATEPAGTKPVPGAGTPSNAVGDNAPGGQKYPYPGDPAAKSGAEPGKPGSSGSANGDGLRDAGSSGDTTGSSSSSSSSSGSDASDTDDNAPIAHRPGRTKLPAVARQSPDEREQEDVRVAGFYQNDGNFRGAYDRAKDAVSLTGDDPDAHLALAQAARKLGKLDEAEQHYKRCLALDPFPKTRKEAERALKEMTGGGG